MIDLVVYYEKSEKRHRKYMRTITYVDAYECTTICFFRVINISSSQEANSQESENVVWFKLVQDVQQEITRNRRIRETEARNELLNGFRMRYVILK